MNEGMDRAFGPKDDRTIEVRSSHPSRETRARWMGHPSTWAPEKPTSQNRDVGHPA
jgi:hypothetical protein